VGEDHSG